MYYFNPLWKYVFSIVMWVSVFIICCYLGNLFSVHGWVCGCVIYLLCISAWMTNPNVCAQDGSDRVKLDKCDQLSMRTIPGNGQTAPFDPPLSNYAIHVKFAGIENQTEDLKCWIRDISKRLEELEKKNDTR